MYIFFYSANWTADIFTILQVWLENNIHFQYRCWFCCNYVRTTVKSDNHKEGKNTYTSTGLAWTVISITVQNIYIYIYIHLYKSTPISIDLKRVYIPVVLYVIVHHKWKYKTNSLICNITFSSSLDCTNPHWPVGVWSSLFL